MTTVAGNVDIHLNLGAEAALDAVQGHDGGHCR